MCSCSGKGLRWMISYLSCSLALPAAGLLSLVLCSPALFFSRPCPPTAPLTVSQMHLRYWGFACLTFDPPSRSFSQLNPPLIWLPLNCSHFKEHPRVPHFSCPIPQPRSPGPTSGLGSSFQPLSLSSSLLTSAPQPWARGWGRSGLSSLGLLVPYAGRLTPQ